VAIGLAERNFSLGQMLSIALLGVPDSRPVGSFIARFLAVVWRSGAHPLRHGTPHRAQPLAGRVRQSAMGDDHRPDSHVACTVSTSLTGLTIANAFAIPLVSLVVVAAHVVGA